MTRRQIPARYARVLNNATHWGFGLATGAAYGLLVGSRRPPVWSGLPFGAAIWAGGYVVLPVLGVYQPIWKYDGKTLQNDPSAHLLFGAATATSFWLLGAPSRALAFETVTPPTTGGCYEFSGDCDAGHECPDSAHQA